VGAFNIMRKYLCRTDENIRPAVVGLDSPKMYRWDGYRFSANLQARHFNGDVVHLMNI